ncbi:IclR family transcriptional regulator [Pectobacterium carotovorum]|uniref:IclR family transcriptional regulator n=1 Tax=Pectobacterium carotovorum TaxID=554 RepID=UPI00057EB539|nr:IclR family transcriptional regulator [Pectobacterium carotovorum]KHT27047.1 IclR family transcriptional regulator [Pectobacterium carotovorum subsp. carotovorum]MDY4375632.1 IclR family transcriptional regulator [Pectobacterium carotovorum subsp. carotovorum]QRN37527.1 IclR family transcriptional regulator [Pectobacterium carotovorum]
MKTRNVQPVANIAEEATRTENVKGELKTLTKGLAALDLLMHNQTVRTSDVADVLAIDKSSASRILQTLAQAGYAQSGERRSFVLGPKLADRPNTVRPKKSLRVCARPVLERLSACTGEAVHLSILADEQVLYLDTIESSYSLRVDSRPGTLAPLAYTAIGRIFLALAGAPLPDQLQAQTEHTITDPRLFQMALQTIAQQGYALHDEEFHLGIRGAAAPLFDRNGYVIGAVGVSGPTVRIHTEDLDALGVLVREEANKFIME